MRDFEQLLRYRAAMLARRRDEVILQRLRQSGTATAQELGLLVQVSAATIRRDLQRLHRQGALERVYGGACLPAARDESPFDDVVDQGAADKEAVAVAAAELVGDDQVVLLDIGTTTMRIARRLRGRRVTVISSSLAVLDVLRSDPEVDLVVLGGTVRRNFQSLVGPLTQDALATVKADVLFLSCTGVDPDGSVVDDISTEATIKRAMVAAARQVVLVAPAAKFPGTGSLRICDVAQLDTIITTTGADESTLERCRRSGGRVVLL